MSQTAAHPVDHVIPHVPVRQWVLLLPIQLRLLLAAQPELITSVLQVVQRVVTRHLLYRAELKAEEGHGGAVTLIQRFGSAANLNTFGGLGECATDRFGAMSSGPRMSPKGRWLQFGRSNSGHTAASEAGQRRSVPSVCRSQFHGRAIHAPHHADLLPAAEFLAWNTTYVFKTPARQVVLAGATPRAVR